jgi:hypothetical protein
MLLPHRSEVDVPQFRSTCVAVWPDPLEVAESLADCDQTEHHKAFPGTFWSTLPVPSEVNR